MKRSTTNQFGTILFLGLFVVAALLLATQNSSACGVNSKACTIKKTSATEATSAKMADSENQVTVVTATSTCGPDCTKPCCAGDAKVIKANATSSTDNTGKATVTKASTCGPGCTKPCCAGDAKVIKANAASSGSNTSEATVTEASTCGPDCIKPCCATGAKAKKIGGTSTEGADNQVTSAKSTMRLAKSTDKTTDQ